MSLGPDTRILAVRAPPKHTARRIVVTGIVSALVYGVVCLWSRSDRSLPMSLFFAAFGVAALAYVWLYRHLPEKLSRSDLWLVFAGAVVFRSIGFFGSPVYENDFYRYLWDGREFAITGNPYAKAPAASFGDEAIPEPFQEILSRINYPDIPTIYGPVAEFSFLLAYYISPGALWPLKLLYIAADLGTLWLLARLMGPSRNLVLYAWSPLLIKEVAFTAHSDVLASMCLVASALASHQGRERLGALGLASGFCARLNAGILVPVFMRKRSGVIWATFILLAIALYAPFVARGTDRGGLTAFLTEWEFNSFGYGVLAAMTGGAIAKVACAGLFLAFYVWAWLRRPDLLRPDVVLGIFFLLAPVVNPWYLTLLVPFVALRPSAWGIAATLSVMVSYATGMNLGRPGMGPFDHPGWVRPLEIAPVLIGLMLELARGPNGRVRAE
jgi:hypothetical protein